MKKLIAEDWLEQWYLLWQDAEARLQKQQEAKLLLMQSRRHTGYGYQCRVPAI